VKDKLRLRPLIEERRIALLSGMPFWRTNGNETQQKNEP
jgi:hypothetical protein